MINHRHSGWGKRRVIMIVAEISSSIIYYWIDWTIMRDIRMEEN